MVSQFFSTYFLCYTSSLHEEPATASIVQNCSLKAELPGFTPAEGLVFNTLRITGALVYSENLQ